MHGREEADLNPTGKMQAINVAAKVKELGIDFVVCSPTRRTIDTARLAAPGIKTIYDKRLLSRDHGEFQGVSKDSLDFAEYWNYNINKKYEKAEQLSELYNRVDLVIKDIKKRYQDKKVLVVTHSGITRMMHFYFNGFPVDGNLLKYKPVNALLEEYELN